MTRAAVTVLCTLAWLGALVVLYRLRDTERVRAEAAADWKSRLRITVGRVAGSVAGALVAGALVLGLGSRLLMRLLAATSSEDAQGRLTEADEVVGEVTIGGTVGLVVFVGIAGGLLGLVLFVGLRRWLPARSIPAGLLTGAIGAGLLVRPSDLLDPDNLDFTLLTPAWLAVTLVLALLATFACTAAVLIDRWAATWPRPSGSARGLAGVAPLALLAPVPPVFAAAVAVTAVRTLVVVPPTARPIDRVLHIVVIAAAVIGAGWVAITAVDILV